MNTIHKQNEKFDIEIETKKKQTNLDLKNTMNEMTNAGKSSIRLGQAEAWVLTGHLKLCSKNTGK